MATFGFLDRFQQAKNDAEAQIRGQLNALKGQNGRLGAQESLAAPTSTTQPPAQQPAQQQAEQPPQIPDTPTLVEPKQVNMDDYHWNRDFVNNFLEAPLTPEEQEKRTRAAHAIAGVGNLGNVLSAFSNLAFAGQAPSQTLPNVPEASTAVDKERAHWNQVRKDYITGNMQGRKYDLDEYRLAQQVANEAAKIKNENERALFTMNMQRYGAKYKEERDKIEDERDKRNFDENVRRYGLDYELKRRAQQISEGHLQIARNQDARAQRQHEDIIAAGGYVAAGKGRGSGKASDGELLESPGGSYHIATPMKSVESVHNMYVNLPPEMKAQYDEALKSTPWITGEDRTAFELRAIGEAVSASDEYAKKLVGLGYLTPVAVKAGTGSNGGGEGKKLGLGNGSQEGKKGGFQQ